MNRTQNYQLCLWDAEDKVQRTDFNADNQKIDTALKSQASAIAAEQAAREKAVSAESSARVSALSALEGRSTTQTIKTAAISEETQSYTLSLSGINWSTWREVIIAAYVYPTGGNIPLYQVYPEGGSDTSSIGGSKFPMVLLLYPLYSSSYPFTGLALGTNPQPFINETSFSKITGLRFQGASGSTISAGSRITVYGLK